MQCSHPLIRVAYKTPDMKKSVTIKIIGSLKDGDLKHYQELNEKHRSLPANTKEWDFGTNNYIYPHYLEYQQIPCGNCMPCRLNYSKQWAIRSVLESTLWEENYFVTFTYNEDNLPRRDEFTDQWGYSWYDEGNCWNGYLKDTDMTKLLKDVREYWRTHFNHTGIRFYYCGEYGTQNFRPHFHALMFNFPIKPQLLKFYKNTPDGNQLYTCPLLEKIWGKGFVVIGQFTWETAAYTARYVTKKWKGETSPIHYGILGQEPEFCRMSRMPGIAKPYFDKHKEQIYSLDEIVLKTTKQKVLSLKPPKYYDKLYDIEYPEDMQRIKALRKFNAEQAAKLKDSTTTLSREQQLELEERQLLFKTKSLIREL